MKDMIIKLHLPDGQLERLLEVSDIAKISLDELIARFLEDLGSEDGPGPLEEWLNELGTAEEDEDQVTLSSKQMELMDLMDQIND